MNLWLTKLMKHFQQFLGISKGRKKVGNMERDQLKKKTSFTKKSSLPSTSVHHSPPTTAKPVDLCDIVSSSPSLVALLCENPSEKDNLTVRIQPLLESLTALQPKEKVNEAIGNQLSHMKNVSDVHIIDFLQSLSKALRTKRELVDKITSITEMNDVELLHVLSITISQLSTDNPFIPWLKTIVGDQMKDRPASADPSETSTHGMRKITDSSLFYTGLTAESMTEAASMKTPVLHSMSSNADHIQTTVHLQYSTQTEHLRNITQVTQNNIETTKLDGVGPSTIFSQVNEQTTVSSLPVSVKFSTPSTAYHLALTSDLKTTNIIKESSPVFLTNNQLGLFSSTALPKINPTAVPSAASTAAGSLTTNDIRGGTLLDRSSVSNPVKTTPTVIMNTMMMKTSINPTRPSHSITLTTETMTKASPTIPLLTTFPLTAKQRTRPANSFASTGTNVITVPTTKTNNIMSTFTKRIEIEATSSLPMDSTSDNKINVTSRFHSFFNDSSTVIPELMGQTADHTIETNPSMSFINVASTHSLNTASILPVTKGSLNTGSNNRPYSANVTLDTVQMTTTGSATNSSPLMTTENMKTHLVNTGKGDFSTGSADSSHTNPSTDLAIQSTEINKLDTIVLTSPSAIPITKNDVAITKTIPSAFEGPTTEKIFTDLIPETIKTDSLTGKPHISINPSTDHFNPAGSLSAIMESHKETTFPDDNLKENREQGRPTIASDKNLTQPIQDDGLSTKTINTVTEISDQEPIHPLDNKSKSPFSQLEDAAMLNNLTSDTNIDDIGINNTKTTEPKATQDHRGTTAGSFDDSCTENEENCNLPNRNQTPNPEEIQSDAADPIGETVVPVNEDKLMTEAPVNEVTTKESLRALLNRLNLITQRPIFEIFLNLKPTSKSPAVHQADDVRPTLPHLPALSGFTLRRNPLIPDCLKP